MVKIAACHKKTEQVEEDDFSYFFHHATPEEKAEVIKRVMREATAEQEKVLSEYRKRTA